MTYKETLEAMTSKGGYGFIQGSRTQSSLIPYTAQEASNGLEGLILFHFSDRSFLLNWVHGSEDSANTEEYWKLVNEEIIPEIKRDFDKYFELVQDKAFGKLVRLKPEYTTEYLDAYWAKKVMGTPLMKLYKKYKGFED